MSKGREDTLKELDARIKDAKGRQEPPPPKEEHYSQAQQGWRMVIELVSGVLIGAAIGYGLDSLFGTLPLFLVAFTLLGFAAGVRTMMRTATELQDERLAEEAEKKGNARGG
jgi:ATP synthase protein I